MYPPDHPLDNGCPPAELRELITSTTTYEQLLLANPYSPNTIFSRARIEDFFYDYMYHYPNDYDTWCNLVANACPDFARPAALVGDRGSGKTVFIHSLPRSRGRGLFVDFEPTKATNDHKFAIYGLRQQLAFQIADDGIAYLADQIAKTFRTIDSFNHFIQLAGGNHKDFRLLMNAFASQISWNNHTSHASTPTKVAEKIDHIVESSDPYSATLAFYVIAAITNRRWLIFDNLDCIKYDTGVSVVVDSIDPILTNLSGVVDATLPTDDQRNRFHNIRTVVVYRRNNWEYFCRSRHTASHELGLGKYTSVDITGMSIRPDIIRHRNHWLQTHRVPLFHEWQSCIEQANALIDEGFVWRDLEWMCNENIRTLAISLAAVAGRVEWRKPVFRTFADKYLWRDGFFRIAIAGLIVRGELSRTSPAWPDYCSNAPNYELPTIARSVLLALYNNLSPSDLVALSDTPAAPDDVHPITGISLDEFRELIPPRFHDICAGTAFDLFAGKDDKLYWSRFLRILGGAPTPDGVGARLERLNADNHAAIAERSALRIALTRSGSNYVERTGRSFELFSLRVTNIYGLPFEPLLSYTQTVSWAPAIECIENTVKLMLKIRSHAIAYLNESGLSDVSYMVNIERVMWESTRTSTASGVFKRTASRPWWDRLIHYWLLYLDDFKQEMLWQMDEKGFDPAIRLKFINALAIPYTWLLEVADCADLSAHVDSLHSSYDRADPGDCPDGETR